MVIINVEFLGMGEVKPNETVVDLELMVISSASWTSVVPVPLTMYDALAKQSSLACITISDVFTSAVVDNSMVVTPENV